MYAKRTADANAGIAHEWAHKNGTEGHNRPKNFFYEGDIIYSYGKHFAMASHYQSQALGHVILMTTDKYMMSNRIGYSMFTERHKHTVRMAISHMQIVYCSDVEKPLNGRHDSNIMEFEIQARRISQQINMRTRKPENFINKINEQYELFCRYCKCFGLDPTEQAEKHGLVYLFVRSRDGSFKATDDEVKAQEKARELAAQRQKEAHKKQHRKDRETLKRWRAFDPKIRLDISSQLHTFNETFLRYNTTKKQIETSKGIELPLDVANRFYGWFYKTLKGGGCTGNCTESILGYRVDTANDNILRVGCHAIPIGEISAIAKQLNWTLPQEAINRRELVKAGKGIHIN